MCRTKTGINISLSIKLTDDMLLLLKKNKKWWWNVGRIKRNRELLNFCVSGSSSTMWQTRGARLQFDGRLYKNDIIYCMCHFSKGFPDVNKTAKGNYKRKKERKSILLQGSQLRLRETYVWFKKKEINTKKLYTPDIQATAVMLYYLSLTDMKWMLPHSGV